ncbi:MAG: hypothetical protein KAR07_08070 [Spirochaetes bacterium]|nr:hypothetical protein [Spirochaetota bacterium]
MIIKRENVVGYVDTRKNKHICFDCFEDTASKDLTVLMKDKMKDDEGCICDKCGMIMW